MQRFYETLNSCLNRYLFDTANKDHLLRVDKEKVAEMNCRYTNLAKVTKKGAM